MQDGRVGGRVDVRRESGKKERGREEENGDEEWNISLRFQPEFLAPLGRYENIYVVQPEWGCEDNFGWDLDNVSSCSLWRWLVISNHFTEDWVCVINERMNTLIKIKKYIYICLIMLDSRCNSALMSTKEGFIVLTDHQQRENIIDVKSTKSLQLAFLYFKLLYSQNITFWNRAGYCKFTLCTSADTLPEFQ